jgi:CheY-like chemotaxis protein
MKDVRATSSPLILVVDDNDAGLVLAVAVLTLEGFEVATAGTSLEVLQRLSERLPDLILMDVQLPGQGGLSLTRQLKADPATAGITIVALSAYTMPVDRAEALRAGCTGYISKPIETRTFGDQVRLFLPRLALPVPVA